MSETTDKTLTYVTKVTNLSIGAASTAKSTVNMLEAVACQDNVYADGLSMAASFILGPNVTTFVTVPISVRCKVFVY